MGTHLRAKIDLPGTTEIEIELEGNVVRIEEEGFAIHFDSIDLESFTFLNNVGKYNSPVSKDENL